MDVSNLSIDGTPSPTKRKKKPTPLFTSPNSSFDLGSPKEMELSTSLSNLKWGFKRREQGLLEQLAIHKEALTELYKLHISLKDKLNAAGTTTCLHLEMMEEVVAINEEREQQRLEQLKYFRTLQKKLAVLEADKLKLEASNSKLNDQLESLQQQQQQQQQFMAGPADETTSRSTNNKLSVKSVAPADTVHTENASASHESPPSAADASPVPTHTGESSKKDAVTATTSSGLNTPPMAQPDTPSRLSARERLLARVAKKKENSSVGGEGEGGLGGSGAVSVAVSTSVQIGTTSEGSVDADGIASGATSPLRKSKNSIGNSGGGGINRRHSAESAMAAPLKPDTTSTISTISTAATSSRRNSYPRKTALPKQDTKSPTKASTKSGLNAPTLPVRGGINPLSSPKRGGKNDEKPPRAFLKRSRAVSGGAVDSSNLSKGTSTTTTDASGTNATTNTAVTTSTGSPRIPLRQRIEQHHQRSRDHNPNQNAWLGGFSTAGRTSGGGMQFFVDIVEPRGKGSGGGSVGNNGGNRGEDGSGNRGVVHGGGMQGESEEASSNSAVESDGSTGDAQNNGAGEGSDHCTANDAGASDDSSVVIADDRVHKDSNHVSSDCGTGSDSSVHSVHSTYSTYSDQLHTHDHTDLSLPDLNPFDSEMMDNNNLDSGAEDSGGMEYTLDYGDIYHISGSHSGDGSNVDACVSTASPSTAGIAKYIPLTLISPTHSAHNMYAAIPAASVTVTADPLADIHLLEAELNTVEEEVSILYTPVPAAESEHVVHLVEGVCDSVYGDTSGSGSGDIVCGIAAGGYTDTTILPPVHNNTLPGQALPPLSLPLHTSSTTSTDSTNTTGSAGNATTNDTTNADSNTSNPNSPNKFIMSELQSYKKQVQVLKAQLASLENSNKPTELQKPLPTSSSAGTSSVGVQCSEGSLFVVDISPHVGGGSSVAHVATSTGAASSSNTEVSNATIAADTDMYVCASGDIPTLFQLAATTPVDKQGVCEVNTENRVDAGGASGDSSDASAGIVVDDDDCAELDTMFVELVDSGVQCDCVVFADSATNTDFVETSNIAGHSSSGGVEASAVQLRAVCDTGVQCDALPARALVSSGTSTHSNSDMNLTTTIPMHTSTSTSTNANTSTTATTATTESLRDQVLLQAIEDSKFELGRKLFELKFAELSSSVGKRSGKGTKGSRSKGIKDEHRQTTVADTKSSRAEGAVVHSAGETTRQNLHTSTSTNSKSTITTRPTTTLDVAAQDSSHTTTIMPSTNTANTANTDDTDTINAELLKLNAELVTRLLHKNSLHTRNQRKIDLLQQKLCRLIMYVKRSSKGGDASPRYRGEDTRVLLISSAAPTARDTARLNTSTAADADTNVISNASFLVNTNHISTTTHHESLRVGDMSYATDLTQLLCIDNSSGSSNSSDSEDATELSPDGVSVLHAHSFYSNTQSSHTHGAPQYTNSTTILSELVDGPTDLFSPRRDFQGVQYDYQSEKDITPRCNPLIRISSDSSVGDGDVVYGGNNGSADDDNVAGENVCGSGDSILDITFSNTSAFDMPQMQTLSNNNSDAFSPIQKSRGGGDVGGSGGVDGTIGTSGSASISKTLSKDTSSGSNYNLNSLYARNPMLKRTNSRTTMGVLQSGGVQRGFAVNSNHSVEDSAEKKVHVSMHSGSDGGNVDVGVGSGDVSGTGGTSPGTTTGTTANASYINPLRAKFLQKTKSVPPTTNAGEVSDASTKAVTSTTAHSSPDATSPSRLNTALSNSVRTISAFQARTSPDKKTINEQSAVTEQMKETFAHIPVATPTTDSTGTHHTTLQSEDLDRELVRAQAALVKLQQHTDYLESRSKNLTREKELLVSKLKHTLHTDLSAQGVKIYTPHEEYSLDNPSVTTSIVLNFIHNNNTLLDKVSALTSALDDKMRQLAKQQQSAAEISADLSQALSQNHHLSADISNIMNLNRNLSTENENYQRQVGQLTGTLVQMAQENRMLKERMKMYSY